MFHPLLEVTKYPLACRSLSSLGLAKPRLLSGPPEGRENTGGRDCNIDATYTDNVSLILTKTYAIPKTSGFLQFSDIPSEI